MMKNVSWMHVVMTVSALGAATAEAWAQYAQGGGMLPFHITASMCLACATFFGLISKSVTPPPAPPEQK